MLRLLFVDMEDSLYSANSHSEWRTSSDFHENYWYNFKGKLDMYVKIIKKRYLEIMKDCT